MCGTQNIHLIGGSIFCTKRFFDVGPTSYIYIHASAHINTHIHMACVCVCVGERLRGLKNCAKSYSPN
jgi:hypothetical protein